MGSLALALGLSPPSAARWCLERISWRESRHNPLVGIHVRDAMLSRRSWLGQVKLGHLDPECQPYVDGWWSTRGPFGLNAALRCTGNICRSATSPRSSTSSS